MLSLLLAAILFVALERAFRVRFVPDNVRPQAGMEFLRTFLLWAALTSLPCLVPLFTMPFSLRLMAALTVPGFLMGAFGAAIMTLVVQPGKKLSAMIVGFVGGSGVPLIVFWGLAVLLPKSEGTLGSALFGFVFAVPSGIAGII